MTDGSATVTWAEQLPVLQVLLPMLTAPLCVLLRHRRVTWALATAALWGTFGISITLLRRVLADGAITYAVGGWKAPYGIELLIEPINAFVLLIVSGISALVVTAAPLSFDQEIPRSRHYLAYGSFLLCVTGLLGMTSAGDAFNVFVFLEISSLSAYSLVAMGRSRRSLVAALRYLMVGTIGGTLLLFGIGLLYGVTGTLNMVDLASRLGAVDAASIAAGGGSSRVLLLALGCIVVGTTVKLALLPLGAWLPDAYTYAPSVVTAFLAATATKVSFYVLVRFVYRVFGADLAFDRLHLDALLLPLAIVAMFVGSWLAIGADDAKRLLAFSSLAQIGYMVLGLSLANQDGLTGGIVHLFNHALMKSGLFLAMACIVYRLGSTRLDAMAGLGRRMPLTMAAFVVGGLSLIGVPLTVGFVSKWYLVRGALEAHGAWLAFLILLSSLLSVVYVWRVVETAYFRPVPDALSVREAPLGLLIPTWAMIGATIWFGLSTSSTVDIAAAAARQLLELGTGAGL